ncbi:MAG: O-antigen ligase family protein, partial [Clostridiaceae bacterium]|nr:O-antigen ligase family protein [Clostridiaceae bacterium]
YYNILQAKYYFYIGSVILLVIAVIFAGCIEHNKLEKYITSFKWNDFIKKFSVTDVALLVFLIIAGISTISSDYVYESFWGNEGRFSGLFLLCLYGVAYFCVTRFGKLKRWYLDAFLIANMLVCIFGITDYFKMDLLHFKVGMLEEQKFMFTSTIGNINTYTALVGMVTAVSAVLFAVEDKWKKQSFYFVSLVISFFALVMGISDNAYLSLAALFGFLPLYLFKNKKGVKSYLLILTAFFSVIQCIDWINTGMGDKVLGIDSAFNIIVKYDGLLLIVTALWISCAVVYGLDYLYAKKKSWDVEIRGGDSEENGKKLTGYGALQIIWLAILIICILGIGYALYDVNIQGNTERYGAIGGYLLFNDDWGTHRGYIWRNAMECFEQFPVMKKIFGFGPDTFGIVLLDKTKGNIYGQIFDNAHNEYLHYLITVGITGLIAYLVFMISFIVRVIRKAGKNKYIVAAFFAVLCYSTQAFVNLNLPIATPIMWMFLMLGELGIRERYRQSGSKDKGK